MPRIPMSKSPGAVPDQSGAVYMNNVPQMRYYGSDGTAEALSNFGNAIGNAGEKIFSGVKQAVSAKEQFFTKMQNTEDHLAATEARNLYRSINEELETRMTENPASFKEFKGWAESADKEYTERVRDFTGRMSPDFRKQFDAEMTGMRIEYQGRRTRIGVQAKVTADYNLFQSQWKDAALRGDLSESSRILETAKEDELISGQEYEQKKLDYSRLSAFGEVRREVEAGSPGIIGKLKARNENGYANYPGLEESAREQFIRAAENMAVKREAEADQEYLAALADGNIPYSDEQLKQMHEGGTLTDRQYHTYKGWNESFTAKQKRAGEELATAQEREKSIAAQKKIAEAKALRADRQKQLDRLFADVGYDDNGYAKTLNDGEYSAAYRNIQKICGEDDPDIYRSALKELNTLREKKLSYQDTPLYMDGDKILTAWKSAGRFAAAKEGWFWDSDSGDKSDEAKFFVERALRIDMDNYCQEHPSASTKDLHDYLETRLKSYNEKKLKDIIVLDTANVNKIIQQADPNGIPTGEVERMVNGRIAIFGPDKKFIRWKDGK